MSAGQVEEWIAGEADAGDRLDRFVGAHAHLGHNAARRLIASGAVRLNGRRAPKGKRLAPGDRVSVAAVAVAEFSGALPPEPEPEASLEVVHVDAEVVVLDKPAGVATHPLRPGERGTLAGALLARYPECVAAGGEPREAGMAHRLDRDTSGLVVAARSPGAWAALRGSFQRGDVRKGYIAVVTGELRAALEIDLSLVHDPGDRRRMKVATPTERESGRGSRGGRVLEAWTRCTPLSSRGGLSLVWVETRTGRMHQVRVHLAQAGHPLLGDLLYGGPEAPLDATGHFLHAARLRVPHPAGGKLDLWSRPPQEREALLSRIGFLAELEKLFNIK